ncbi:MAG: hypothetical protein WDW21_04185 [Neisseriaceae bacterium]
MSSKNSKMETPGFQGCLGVDAARSTLAEYFAVLRNFETVYQQ